MAKAAWVATNPESGSGNSAVAVSSSAPHTGRVTRNTTITFTAASVEPVAVVVNQAGKPEFTTSQDRATAAMAGQNVTISGTSNSSELTFTLGSGTLEVVLPANYTANGVSTSNGAVIAGDPGAVAQYSFSITLTVPANAGVTELSRQIVVTDGAGTSATTQLTQAAGDATLSVSPLTVELDWEGNAESVQVTSNTSWVIS